MKLLTSAESLNIERVCKIIKTLNNKVSLFESFDVEAVCRSEFLLALTQVVENPLTSQSKIYTLTG